MEFQRIGVVGAGQMGSGIAQVAAAIGADTLVTDVDERRLDVGRKAVEKSLQRMVKKDKLTEDEMQQIQDRIQWSVHLSAHADRQLVVEAIPEVEELKHQILTGLEAQLSPEAVLASNTSSISIIARLQR